LGRTEHFCEDFVHFCCKVTLIFLYWDFKN
jgi:hypothetical protein